MITSQPERISATSGTQVLLTIEVTAPSEIWQKTGADLAGKTNASMALNNVQKSEDGNYTIVVSTGNDSAKSQTAVVTVQKLSSITNMVCIAQGTYTLGSPSTEMDRGSDETHRQR